MFQTHLIHELSDLWFYTVYSSGKKKNIQQAGAGEIRPLAPEVQISLYFSKCFRTLLCLNDLSHQPNTGIVTSSLLSSRAGSVKEKEQNQENSLVEAKTF